VVHALANESAREFCVSDLTRTVEALAELGPVRPLWTAIIVTVVFASLARWVRGVSFGGAIAGAAVCFLLYVGAGFGAFVALVSVFALTWISTRFGYRRKERLGTAEKLDGRTALQVLANLAVAASCAGLSAVTAGKAVFLLAVSAALSEAAADTVSSELGQARSANARLITTWEEVAAGTDGGVSWTGTVAGVAAAAVVSFVCVLAGLVPLRWLGISIVAAVAGMIADSFLGALLERRKLLNNDAVNFLGTLIAACAASLLV
jgi:uncharacterized protein (TIGR00297 family)